MKTKLMAFVVLMLAQTSAFAQYGGGPPGGGQPNQPTTAQTQALSAANNASMAVAAARGEAGYAWQDALNDKAALPSAPTRWSDDMKATYNNLIASGNGYFQTGDTFWDLGEYYKLRGDGNYIAGNGLWFPQYPNTPQYADAVIYFNNATDLWTVTAVPDYDTAQARYQDASTTYQAALSYYYANSGPPI